MSSRKDVRLEKKKRKAAAFLQLVADSNEVEKQANDDEEPSECKKPKIAVEGSSGDGSVANYGKKEKSMSDEMYAEYKQVISERRKASMQKPKVFLTMDELTRDYSHLVDENGVKQAPPLFIRDVQHLLMFAVLNVHSSFRPRWCRLLRVCKVTKVVAVVLDSLSATEFKEYSESLPTLGQAFDINVDMLAPVQYGSSVREDIMNVPVRARTFAEDNLPDSKPKQSKQMEVRKLAQIVSHQKWQKHKTLYKTVRNLMASPIQSLLGAKLQAEQGTVPGEGTTQHDDTLSDPTTDPESRLAAEGEEGEQEEFVSTFKQDRFDRRWLMLNSAQMQMESIPTPTDINNKNYKGFTFSKRKYSKVTSRSPLFAVDCEMVQTTASKMDLARISIVDENLEVVYDSFVKPRARVTNYVTQFSGITAEILDPVTTSLNDIQKVIRMCLPPDAILCGQSISSDLNSMKLFHPYLIDTSVIYDLTGNRRKTGLKKLTALFLSRNIQDNSAGHDSVEDANATMELVLLKLRNKVNFGDVKMDDPLPLADIDELAAGHDLSDSDDTEDRTLLVTRTRLDTDISPELERKRLFFQQDAHKFIESFLQRMAKHNKTGIIIDEADSVDLYPKTQSVATGTTDKDSQIQTLESLQHTEFCFTHLYGYRNFLRANKDSQTVDESDKKKCLWKLDRRIWKIMMGLPECSLFVVILTGRNDNGAIHSAKTFAKIL